MNDNNEEIESLLRFDPVQSAEDALGAGHASEVGGLALRLTALKTAALKTVLKENKDSHHGSTLKEYQEIIADLGFVNIYEKPFTRVSPYDQNKTEDIRFIYHQPELGIVLIFDTYWEKVNEGHFYYNWQHEMKPMGSRVTSSGCYYRHGLEFHQRDFDEKWNSLPHIWLGYHHCQTAIRYHIELLKKHGTFLKDWVEWDAHWIFNAQQTTGQPFEHSNAASLRQIDFDNEIFKSLPEYFQKQFGKVYWEHEKRQRAMYSKK